MQERSFFVEQKKGLIFCRKKNKIWSLCNVHIHLQLSQKPKNLYLQIRPYMKGESRSWNFGFHPYWKMIHIFLKYYLSCCQAFFSLTIFFLQVASLVNLVAQIKPTDESDYFLLHTIISLISFAVGSEDLPSKERVNHDSFVLQIKDEEAW